MRSRVLPIKDFFLTEAFLPVARIPPARQSFSFSTTSFTGKSNRLQGMGNVPSRGGAETEHEEKLRTLAALSSRILAGSGDSLNQPHHQHQQHEGSTLSKASPPMPPTTGMSPGGRTILSASLKDKELTFVPGELFLLADLNALDLSKNKLRSLPVDMAKLKKLKRLALGSNHIGVIPDFFSNFQDLAWLDFTHNDVHTVSDSLGDLPMLASLGASDCRLTEFPQAFCRLQSLRKLGVFNNMITSLPAEIGNLRSLTKLDLSGNALVTLPPEIGKLTELTWLNLSKNQLESLPAELGRLTKLQELGLAFNKLKTLPDLSRCKELSLLPVYSNELEEIGEWICDMPVMSKLDLSYNQLRSVPKGIFRLPNLTFINLRHNQLEQVPPYNPDKPRERSKTLQSIDLRDNQLRFMPISLMGPALVELKCSNNPLITEPGFIQVGSCEGRSLKDHAMNALLNTLFDNHLPTTIRIDHKRAFKKARMCENCNRRYLLDPAKHIIFAETSDHPFAAFLMEACSMSCMEGFQAMLARSSLSPSGSEGDDPRSPRAMLLD